MPEKVDEIHDTLMRDPDFESEGDKTRDESAWSVAWSKYNQMKKNDAVLSMVDPVTKQQMTVEIQEESSKETPLEKAGAEPGASNYTPHLPKIGDPTELPEDVQLAIDDPVVSDGMSPVQKLGYFIKGRKGKLPVSLSVQRGDSEHDRVAWVNPRREILEERFSKIPLDKSPVAVASPVSKARPGLVRRKVQVKRGGKVFEREQWVRPDEAATIDRQREQRFKDDLAKIPLEELQDLRWAQKRNLDQLLVQRKAAIEEVKNAQGELALAKMRGVHQTFQEALDVAKQEKQKIAKRVDGAIVARENVMRELAARRGLKEGAARLRGKDKKEEIPIPPQEQQLWQDEGFSHTRMDSHNIDGSEESVDEYNFRTSTIVDVERIKRAGVNASYKVKFENGATAIFKPRAGEARGLRRDTHVWDPRQKKYIERISAIPDDEQFVREAFAYKLAKFIDFDHMVPMTTAKLGEVPKDVDPIGRGLELGASQQWIDDAKQIGETTDWRQKIASSELQDAAFWDVLSGNTDRHMGNSLVEKKGGKLWLIDNGLSFPEVMGELWHESDPGGGNFNANRADLRSNFVNELAGRPLEQRHIDALEKLKENETMVREGMVKSGLSEQAANHMYRRIDNMLDHRQYKLTAPPRPQHMQDPGQRQKVGAHTIVFGRRRPRRQQIPRRQQTPQPARMTERRSAKYDWANKAPFGLVRRGRIAQQERRRRDQADIIHRDLHNFKRQVHQEIADKYKGQGTQRQRPTGEVREQKRIEYYRAVDKRVRDKAKAMGFRLGGERFIELRQRLGHRWEEQFSPSPVVPATRPDDRRPSDDPPIEGFDTAPERWVGKDSLRERLAQQASDVPSSARVAQARKNLSEIGKNLSPRGKRNLDEVIGQGLRNRSSAIPKKGDPARRQVMAFLARHENPKSREREAARRILRREYPSYPELPNIRVSQLERRDRAANTQERQQNRLNRLPANFPRAQEALDRRNRVDFETPSGMR